MENHQLYIAFYLNRHRINKRGECKVSMRITIHGQREVITTGVSVSPEVWDNNKSRIKGKSPTANSQNNLLSTWKSRATSIYSDLLNSGMPVSSTFIKNKLLGTEDKTTSLMEVVALHNAYVSKRVDVEVCKATHTKYETLRKKLEAYLRKEHSRTDIFLKELNQRFVIGFELFLKLEEKIAHNTTIKYVQFLKRIINFAIANEYILHNPFSAFKCTFQPVIRECLTQDEIDRIHTKEISIQRLAHVRDIFVFSCYTGLAYADVKKLKYSEIVKGNDGGMWIQTVRAKTNIRVPVPLLPPALALIDKYKTGSYTGADRVFPVPSNQKVNAYLKEIADICGVKKRLFFHIARHSFSTTLALSNGVPIETLSRMLGHTNIKTTQIYGKILDTKIGADMKQLEQQLMKK
ncbi:MAG: site-specific integrase [Flavipsychrobacter sp.]|nr:site-specific integrase [Flavipsychrobacter sp.]